MSDNCVVLFIKTPVRGQVKTRLAVVAGMDRAVGLYRCFVEDTVAMLDGLNVPTRFCYHGPGDAEALAQWLGSHRSYARQRGDDLGQRMANAFREAFAQGFSKVVLIGSDFPDLPQGILRQAFVELDACGVVVGPSSDGGYYLIGFAASHFLPEAFEDVPWGTGRVFERTIEILKGRSVRPCVLPTWHDVDTWADLQDLIQRNADTPFRRSRTWAFLQRSGWADGAAGRSERDV